MNDFRIAINQICNQRQLPKEVIIEAIELALVSAYKKNFGPNQNISVRIDPDTGKARVFIVRDIVEEVEDERNQISIAQARKLDAMAQIGGTIEEETKPRNFGRIAAQTAKQVILQRIREAERDIMYGQYMDREGEIINGVVRNVDERGNVILSLGKTEAILPRNEKIRTESYHQGQRLRTYVIEVQKTSRGPQILVSRTHRQFLRRLLELEVPEIFNGTVEIQAIAREPGSRSKIAVSATQEGIDPVGSCVGVRGVRIQNVVNELSGEKIDVVAWDADPAVFVANSLSPAKVARVDIDEESNTATVIVPDNQLSLSIGKEGQNARLAAKLTSWRIDIKSVTEAEQEAVQQAENEAARAEEKERLEAARAEARALLAQAESLIIDEAEVDDTSMAADTEPDQDLDIDETPEDEPAIEPVELESPAEPVADSVEVEPEDTTVEPVMEDSAEVEPESAESVIEEQELDQDLDALYELEEEPVQMEAEPAQEPSSMPEIVLPADEEDQDDEDSAARKRKKQRQKRWQYEWDAESDEVIAQRRRKQDTSGGGRRRRDWQDGDTWKKS